MKRRLFLATLLCSLLTFTGFLSAKEEAEIRFTSAPDLFNWNISNPQEGWEDTLDWFFKILKEEGPDFHLNAGDIMDARWYKEELVREKTEQYWTGFKKRYDDHGMTLYVAPGDHEYGDDQGLRNGEIARVFAEQFTNLMGMPTNGPENHKGRAFYNRHGNLLMVTLDTFEDEGAKFGYTVGDEQVAWLDKVLKENEDAEFIIVQGHLPIVGPVKSKNSSASMMQGGTNSKVWKTMVKHGVDVYLCGEHHRITTLKSDGIWQVVHGALWGTQKDLNYLRGSVKGKALSLELLEFDVEYEGDYIQDHPHRKPTNKPREIVKLSEKTKSNGPRVTGTLTLDKSEGEVAERVTGWFEKGLGVSSILEKVNVKTVEGAPRVLYVTHEPGKWHDYTGQRKVFEEVAQKQNWTTDVLSSSYDGLLVNLSRNPDFAEGYDVVIYNICLADAEHLMAAYNIIKQTKEGGVSSLLIHGALHTFFKTYTERALGKKAVDKLSVGTAEGVADPLLVKKWNRLNKGKDFPVWGDFCGMASQGHAQKAPIQVKKLMEHPAAKGVPENYVTGKSELYLTYYKTENLQEILLGSVKGKKPAPILWEQELGKGKVMGFSVGHFTKEWSEPNFQSAFIGSVNYLAE